MTAQKISVRPTTIKAANAFVKEHHRHSKPTQGGRFAIEAVFRDEVVGVAIVGRPVSASIDQKMVAEVTRLCVSPTAPKNTCSFLYAKCWRIWQQMGGKQMITYTLQRETGASLRGAGWQVANDVAPHGGWARKNRPRQSQQIYGQPKRRWETHTEE